MIWEISCTWFSWNRQADWGKTVCPAFRRSAARVRAVYPWSDYKPHQHKRYTISNHLPWQIFYSQKIESSPDGSAGGRFILLLVASSCYNPWAADRIDRQGIWNLLAAYLKSEAGIHLWNAYGSGVGRRLHVLLSQSSQQPCKQPAKKAKGCSWSAGVYQKRLRHRL